MPELYTSSHGVANASQSIETQMPTEAFQGIAAALGKKLEYQQKLLDAQRNTVKIEAQSRSRVAAAKIFEEAGKLDDPSAIVPFVTDRITKHAQQEINAVGDDEVKRDLLDYFNDFAAGATISAMKMEAGKTADRLGAAIGEQSVHFKQEAADAPDDAGYEAAIASLSDLHRSGSGTVYKAEAVPGVIEHEVREAAMRRYNRLLLVDPNAAAAFMKNYGTAAGLDASEARNLMDRADHERDRVEASDANTVLAQSHNAIGSYFDRRNQSFSRTGAKKLFDGILDEAMMTPGVKKSMTREQLAESLVVPLMHEAQTLAATDPVAANELFYAAEGLLPSTSNARIAANQARAAVDNALTVHEKTVTAAEELTGSILSGNSDIDLSRPIIKNEDNTFSTEKTITVSFEEDGKEVFYNIPTIVNGKELSEEQAIDAYKKGQNKAVGRFSSLAEAEAAAVERSKKIGELRGGEVGQGRTYDPATADAAFGNLLDKGVPFEVAASRFIERGIALPPKARGIIKDQFSTADTMPQAINTLRHLNYRNAGAGDVLAGELKDTIASVAMSATDGLLIDSPEFKKRVKVLANPNAQTIITQGQTAIMPTNDEQRETALPGGGVDAIKAAMKITSGVSVPSPVMKEFQEKFKYFYLQERTLHQVADHQQTGIAAAALAANEATNNLVPVPAAIADTWFWQARRYEVEIAKDIFGIKNNPNAMASFGESINNAFGKPKLDEEGIAFTTQVRPSLAFMSEGVAYVPQLSHGEPVAFMAWDGRMGWKIDPNTNRDMFTLLSRQLSGTANPDDLSPMSDILWRPQFGPNAALEDHEEQSSRLVQRAVDDFVNENFVPFDPKDKLHVEKLTDQITALARLARWPMVKRPKAEQ